MGIPEILSELFPKPAAHAGPMETSVILAIASLLVQQDRYGEASKVTRWGKTIAAEEIQSSRFTRYADGSTQG